MLTELFLLRAVAATIAKRADGVVLIDPDAAEEEARPHAPHFDLSGACLVDVQRMNSGYGPRQRCGDWAPLQIPRSLP